MHLFPDNIYPGFYYVKLHENYSQLKGLSWEE